MMRHRSFVRLGADGRVDNELDSYADSDGLVTDPALIEVTDHPQWHGMGSLSGHAWNPDGTFTPPVPAPKRVFSRVEFMRLFSMATFLAIDALETAGDPGVRYFLALLRLAEYVDLDDPVVATGLQQISAQHPTVLSAEEVARVLAGEPPE